MFGELGATTVLDRSSAEWSAGGLVAPGRRSDSLPARAVCRKASASRIARSHDPLPLHSALGVDDAGAEHGGPSEGYGLGLIRMERAGMTLLGHGGLFTGHTASLFHIPDCDVTIALYFNRGFVNQRAALDRIVPVVTRNPDGSTRCGQGQLIFAPDTPPPA